MRRKAGMAACGAVALLVLAAGQGAPAWAVNKCIGPDGKVTYTDSPCEGGSRVTRIENPPAPTPAEQAAARARGERMVDDARALEARQAAAAAARQRRVEAEQAALQRQAQQEARDARDDRERLVVVRPIVRRHPPPVLVLPPRPRPVEPQRPASMLPYPFK